MSIQLAVSTRNARLDAIETEIGAAPILKIIAGTVPADCAAADPGTVLSSMTLPTTGGDWLATASGGVKSKSGTWQDTSADATGTATHFRIYDTGGSTCKLQGTCSMSGGGGDMVLDNTSISTGQLITVVSFALTDANA